MCDSFCESWQDPLIRKIEACRCSVPLQGSILLVTDRMPQIANALAACISRCTSCTVLGVAQNPHSAKQLAEHHRPDFLVFVGYQSNPDHYRIHFPGAARVLWASADAATQKDCKQYSIPHQFEKFSNPHDFFCYLQTISR